MVRAHRPCRPGPPAGVALLLAVLVLTGCASRGQITTADRAEPVSGGGVVALVPIEATASARNDHPLDIDDRVLERVLASLTVTSGSDTSLLGRLFSSGDGGDAGPRPLFTDATLERLAPALAGALSQARPDQDIVFSIRQSRSEALGGAVRFPTTTSGRVFHRGGRLHLIPGAVDRKSDQGSSERLGDRPDVGPAPVRIDGRTVIASGTRREPAAPGLAIASQLPGAGRMANRPDHIALPLDVEPREPQTAQRRESTGPAAAAGEADTDTRAAGERPATGAPGGQVREAPGGGTGADAAGSELDLELIRKAETLRELRERELIDESTYQDLLREVLDEAFLR